MSLLAVYFVGCATGAFTSAIVVAIAARALSAKPAAVDPEPGPRMVDYRTPGVPLQPLFPGVPERGIVAVWDGAKWVVVPGIRIDPERDFAVLTRPS